MESKIFISYRRGDDAGFAHALHARLMQTFNTNDVFMDVQGHIAPGDQFSEVIKGQLSHAEVILVIIGNRWHQMFSDASDHIDWVKYEIVTAMDMGKRIVPVLVDDTPLPGPETLPEEVRALCSFQTVELRPKKFAADAGELVDYLKRSFKDPEPLPPKPQRNLLIPIAAGAVLLLFVIATAWYAGIIGGDYPTCIQAAEARWEEIRKCAIQHEFSL